MMTLLLIVFFVLGALSGYFERRDLKAERDKPINEAARRFDDNSRRRAAVQARRNGR